MNERTVHKFAVGFGSKARAEIQKGARLLYVAPLNGTIWLWAEVDPREEKYFRPMGYFNTGDLIPQDWHHVGTFVGNDEDGDIPAECVGEGHYVGHVYDGLAAM